MKHKRHGIFRANLPKAGFAHNPPRRISKISGRFSELVTLTSRNDNFNSPLSLNPKEW